MNVLTVKKIDVLFSVLLSLGLPVNIHKINGLKLVGQNCCLSFVPEEGTIH